MENKKKPLLIRPSRTPEQIPTRIFVLSLSLLLSPVHGCVPVIFHMTFQKFCKTSSNPFHFYPNLYEWNMTVLTVTHKNHVLAPKEGKDWGQKYFWDLFQGSYRV